MLRHAEHTYYFNILHTEFGGGFIKNYTIYTPNWGIAFVGVSRCESRPTKTYPVTVGRFSIIDNLLSGPTRRARWVAITNPYEVFTVVGNNDRCSLRNTVLRHAEHTYYFK